ncbi:MAG: hypothetical protein AB7I27_15275 [Bacteriovoracaceae bacterium]
MKCGIIFCILIFSSAVFAQFSCPNSPHSFFSKIYNEENGIVPNDVTDLQQRVRVQNNLGCKEAELVEELVSSIKTMINGQLLLADKLILNLRYASDGAHLYGNIFDVPMKYGNSKTLESDILTKAVWAHEYGHAIFEKNFLIKIPDFVVVVENSKRANELVIERTFLKYTIFQNKKDLEITQSLGNQTQLDLLAEKIAQDTKQLKDLESRILDEHINLGNNWAYLEILPFYHELFADLVATLLFKNGSIVSQSLSSIGLSNNQTECRDFENPGNELYLWRPNDEEHCALAPARFFLWKMYQSNNEFRARSGEFLRLVFNSIVEELIYYHPLVLSNSVDVMSDSFILEMNERLISRLKESLATSIPPSNG